MCSAELAERLGVHVKWGNVELITANAITHEKKKVDFLAIQGIEEESAFMVKDALVQDSIVDVSSSIPTHEMVKDYSHLRDLKFPEIENQKIELLLGSDLCYGKYSLSFEPEFISAFDLLNFCLTINLIHFIISRRSLAN